jgi:hypothetical protein
VATRAAPTWAPRARELAVRERCRASLNGVHVPKVRSKELPL